MTRRELFVISFPSCGTSSLTPVAVFRASWVRINRDFSRGSESFDPLWQDCRHVMVIDPSRGPAPSSTRTRSCHSELLLELGNVGYSCCLLSIRNFSASSSAADIANVTHIFRAFHFFFLLRVDAAAFSVFFSGQPPPKKNKVAAPKPGHRPGGWNPGTPCHWLCVHVSDTLNVGEWSPCTAIYLFCNSDLNHLKAVAMLFFPAGQAASFVCSILLASSQEGRSYHRSESCSNWLGRRLIDLCAALQKHQQNKRTNEQTHTSTHPRTHPTPPPPSLS